MSLGATLVVSFYILLAIIATRILVLDYRWAQAPENDIGSKFVYILGDIFIWGVVCFGIWISIREDIKKTNIESVLNENYTGYTNYKHDNTNTFVCDGKKYSFDYDYDTNTLTIFNETGTVIDGTYVNGQKTNNDNKTDVDESVLETELESKIPDTSVDTHKADPAPVSENNSNFNKRIQSTILERYTDAFITSYDANAISGTFDASGISYKFVWSDNLLEVTEIDNPDSVTYMKIAE